MEAVGGAVLRGSVGDALGFSKEVGAFLAGISIASTPYREQVAARLVSLRDFLLLFFFIELGAGLDLSLLGAQLGASAVFSLFVLIGNPLIVMAIMGYMGYRKRTGFLSGLTVAQISEFSLVLVALGLSLGHLEQKTVGLATLVKLVTISVSTYMILYSHLLYERLAPWLSIFERKSPQRELDDHLDERVNVDVLLIGLGRYGAVLATNLRELDCRLLAVDFDPESIQRHSRDSYKVQYGDTEDPEFVATLSLTRIKWVVSTVRDRSTNRMLLLGLRQQNYRGGIVIATYNQQDAQIFEQEGIDMVLMPYEDAAREAASWLMSGPMAGNHQTGDKT